MVSGGVWIITVTFVVSSSRCDDVRVVGMATSVGDARRDSRSVRAGHMEMSYDDSRRDSHRKSDLAQHRTGSSSAQCEIFVRNNTSYRLLSQTTDQLSKCIFRRNMESFWVGSRHILSVCFDMITFLCLLDLCTACFVLSLCWSNVSQVINHSMLRDDLFPAHACFHRVGDVCMCYAIILIITTRILQ